jgi:predicted amidohydrolase
MNIAVVILAGIGAVALAGAQAPPPNLIANPQFEKDNDGIPAGWARWSPQPALAPESSVVKTEFGRALAIQSRSFPSIGKWLTVVKGIRGGGTYEFQALYRPANVDHEDVSVAAILSWCKDEDGKAAIQRDYAEVTATSSGWRTLSRRLPAPQASRSVRVELLLRWTERGSVLWREPRVVETAPVRHRMVRVATTHLRPQGKTTVENNLDLIGKMLDRAAAEKPDLVLLSETLVDYNVGRPLSETAETIPGPATRMLCEKARKLRAYVATTLRERDGDLFYNTAVLIDRGGEIIGKYRKTHLPLFEAEEGVTPGRDYAVFQTDFGKVGILTCWDNWFPEIARILRLKGAELLLLPIAGDGHGRHWDVISRARAMDNGVYLISSNTVGQSPSRIIDPAGEVVAETAEPFGLAVAEIDLDASERVPWLSVGPGLGEPKSLYIRERRPDTYGPLGQDRISGRK